MLPKLRLRNRNWHNVREWIGLSAWILSAVLLAYGVIRVPAGVRWVYRHYHGEPAVQEKQLRLLVLALQRSDNSVRSTVAAFQALAQEKPRTTPDGHVLQISFSFVPLDAKKINGAVERLVQRYTPSTVLLFDPVEDHQQVELEVQAFRGPGSADGPQRYLSRLPLHEMQNRLAAAGFPATMAYTVGEGDVLANAAFYHLMTRVTGAGKAVPAGLIQVPASWPAERLVSVFHLIIESVTNLTTEE